MGVWGKGNGTCSFYASRLGSGGDSVMYMGIDRHNKELVLAATDFASTCSSQSHS